MTVCIAALAERSRAIILVADKMSSLGEMVRDTDVHKILPVGHSGWAAMTAGHGARCDAVVRSLSKAVDQNPAIAESAESLGRQLEDAYRAMKESAEDREILAPHLLTRELWAKRGKDMLPLPEPVIRDIREEIFRFEINCDLIVCGFDRTGRTRRANIVLISKSGIAENVTNEGFCAIGIGWETAAGRLFWQAFRRTDRLDRVLYETLDAKAHAELMAHVGYGWDATVLLPGRMLAVPGGIKTTINDLFDASTESPFDRQPKQPPKGWQKKLAGYRKRVMANVINKKRGRRKRV